MEGGGLEHMVLSIAACAIAVLLGLSAFAVPGRSERSSPMFVLATPPGGTYFDFVVSILMENHGICDILTYCGGSAPFETQLANASGLATNYSPSPCGKSLADYLCLTGASTFGCTENPNPNSDACTRLAWQSPNIVDRLVDAGLTWKAYMENMTSDCGSPAGTGYVVRHNPFAYYGDIVTNATRCARVVPAGIDDRALLDDLGSASNASNYMWLTPNLCNDMDVCPVAAGDAYLSNLVPKILGSTVFTTERAALFITFDEAANGRGTPAIYTVWSGPAAKVGYTSSVSYNHFSHLATVEANWNLPTLNTNDSGARNMSEFFVGSPPDFSLSASPWSLSFIAGGSAMSNVSLQSQNGFQGAVTLDATSSPAGVTAVCSPSVIHGGETSACTMTSSAAGSFDVTVSGTAGARVNHVTIHIQVIGRLSAQIGSPSSTFTGQSVDFLGSALGGQSPYNYSWQLGDQSTMTGDRVSHVYSSEGVYRVNLTIDDGSGQVALASKDLTVARSTPGVLTEAATGVEDVRATLHGDLRNLGEATTVIVGFLYGLDPTLSGATNWTSGPASRAGVYASLVTGLTPNTTYYFDAWATGHGFTTGGIMSFTTMASSMPSGTPGATVRVEGTLGTNGWYVSDVTVTLTASDSLPFVAWIHYVVDEGGWLNYTAPLTLHDGKHTLSYYAFDASSSPPERNQYLNVSVDTTPPVVSLEDPSPVVTSSFPVHWTGSDAGSGIAGYEIQVDGGAFQTVGIATSVTLDLADGVHTFTVRATDVAGNKETQTRSVSVDTNPFSPFGPLAGLPLFLLLLALAIAVTILLLRRRRKRKGTPAKR